MTVPTVDETAPTNDPPAAAGRSRLRAALLVAVGLALLGTLLYSTGLAPILEHMRILGGRAPLVIVPYLLVALIDTFGWRCTLPRGARVAVPFAALYLTRMAGEAINSVTPTATVGGEPVKAYLLRSWGVAGVDGVVSVLLARTALVVSQSMFVAFGVAALFIHLEHAWWGLVWLAAMLVLVLGFGTALVALQLRNPTITVWRLLRRIFRRSHLLERLQHHATSIDRGLEHFYRFERRAFVQATALYLFGWLFGVWEVHLMMWLIDAPVTWLDAFIIESLAQPIRAVAIVIPGGVGAQEWGGAWLCMSLGVPEPAAVTLWLLKRARETVFDVVGLTYMTTRSRRA